jgi:AraC-like DNA-binding protein
MAIREEICIRDGVPMPIQCLYIKNTRQTHKTMHYHDYAELLFGISGKANAYVGMECYPFDAGAMVLIRDGEFHDVTAVGETAEYIVVKFLPSVLHSAQQTFSEYVYTRLLLQKMDGGKTFFAAEELSDTAIPRLFHRLLSEWETARFGYELSLRADVTQIVLHIMRAWEAEAPTLAAVTASERQSTLIQRAITHVDAHYAEITEEGCARALGVSPAYLSRVFKRGMKTPFSAYVTGVKLKEAEKLLATSAFSMTEIAERVGFSTVAYFIASFRAVYGTTPARYRKLLHGAAAPSLPEARPKGKAQSSL